MSAETDPGLMAKSAIVSGPDPRSITRGAPPYPPMRAARAERFGADGKNAIA
jgi:hypothetical protein